MEDKNKKHPNMLRGEKSVVKPTKSRLMAEYVTKRTSFLPHEEVVRTVHTNSTNT